MMLKRALFQCCLLYTSFPSLDSLFAEIHIESAYSVSLIFPEPYSRVIACVVAHYDEMCIRDREGAVEGRLDNWGAVVTR